ncbi:MAG: PEP-CTERM sorting domain-containing protein [Xenococcaceae cyanobacterium]
MNKPHLLQKLAPVGIGAIGAIAVTGIATAPAQAANLTGQLSWSNGINGDYDDAADSFDVVGNDFTTTFSPDDTGAFVTTASGDFASFFPGVPEVFPTTATATFENILIIDPPVPGFVAEAEYQLTTPLSFDFGNDVTATLPVGTTFLGELGGDGSVEFSLNEGEFIFNAPGFDQTTAFSSDLTFGQPLNSDEGDYSASSEVQNGAPVPEPATLLALLGVGSLSLSLKHNKKSWKAS